MNETRDLDRDLRAFLAEGANELPDRVYDQVSMAIEQTRQRATIGPWRFPLMHALKRPVTYALAAVIIGILGIVALPRVITRDMPAGAPSASAPASPDSSVNAYSWPGFLAAGTYTTDFAFDLPVAVTFTVPDGWESRDIDINKGRRVSLRVMVVENLFSDACGGILQDPPIGPATDDLIAALASVPGLDVPIMAPASLAGLEGSYLEWGLSADAGCSPLESRVFRLVPLICDASCGGLGSQDIGAEPDSDGARNETWILDAGGGLRMIVQAISSADASVDDLVELQAVLGSMAIEPKVPASPSPEPPAS